MYEVGTMVRYHGSLERHHGETFMVVRHCCGGTRYTLDGDHLLRHIRHVSVSPLDGPDVRADLTRAIADQRPVMITYVAGDGVWTTRTIEPYELAETGPDPGAAPDPEADWWTIAEVAVYLGVRESTVIVYRSRGKKGIAGGLPPEDRKFGGSPVYRPATIIGWKRPGRGAGGGRPRKDDP